MEDFLRMAEDGEKGREDLKRAGMGVTGRIVEGLKSQ